MRARSSAMQTRAFERNAWAAADARVGRAASGVKAR